MNGFAYLLSTLFSEFIKFFSKKRVITSLLSSEDCGDSIKENKYVESKLKRTKAFSNLRHLETIERPFPSNGRLELANPSQSMKEREYLFSISSFKNMGCPEYDDFSWEELYRELYQKNIEPVHFEASKLKSLAALSQIPLNNLYKHDAIKQLKIKIPENGKTGVFRKTLILDLDETLVHTDIKRKFSNHDTYLRFKNEKEFEVIPLNKRPGLQEFLEFATELFEIIIYTASSKNYADVVLDHIDPNNKYFSHRLYRDSCINLKNIFTIKPISLIEKRAKDDIIIVDNNVFSFSADLANGYLISSFYHDKSDCELDKLKTHLLSLFGK